MVAKECGNADVWGISQEEIVSAFGEAKGYPTNILDAADRRSKELAPCYRHILDDWSNGDEGVRESSSAAVFFIFHQLAEWRDKEAYRPLIRLLASPPEFLDELLGHAVTETSHRVIASVFDGDPHPLFDLILDPHADMFVRARMLDALAMVTLDGQLERAKTIQFLKKCYKALEPDKGGFVWVGWQRAIILLDLKEMCQTVESAFDKGYIDETITNYGLFKKEISGAGKHLPQNDMSRYTFLDGTKVKAYDTNRP